jgi:hypothetical protein
MTIVDRAYSKSLKLMGNHFEFSALAEDEQAMLLPV